MHVTFTKDIFTSVVINSKPITFFMIRTHHLCLNISVLPINKMEHVNKPSFPNDSILVKHSCKITQNSLNPFIIWERKYKGGCHSTQVVFISKVWNRCLGHLRSSALVGVCYKRSIEWKVSCSIPVLSLADNFSFGTIRGWGMFVITGAQSMSHTERAFR